MALRAMGGILFSEEELEEALGDFFSFDRRSLNEYLDVFEMEYFRNPPLAFFLEIL